MSLTKGPNHMRKLTAYTIICSLIILGFTACHKPAEKKNDTVNTSAQPAENNAKEKKGDVNPIFIQTAKSAVLKKLSTHGYYTLMLYNVNPYSTYYVERPERESGIIPVGEFIKTWDTGKNSFQQNNPNAFLTAAFIDGVSNKDSKFYLLTCSTPQYDLKNNTLIYVVKPLPRHTLIFEYIKLDYVTLIIDAG
jgi:hypothetical protein